MLINWTAFFEGLETPVNVVIGIVIGAVVLGLISDILNSFSEHQAPEYSESDKE